MKKIGIIGTGVVGQTLAAKLTSLDYEVMIGTRNVKDTLSKDQKDNYGRPPFKEWYKDNPTVKLGTFDEAAAFGEFIINATNGKGALPALKLAGVKNLSGKVLLDISNPLDFSKGHAAITYGLQYRFTWRANSARISRCERCKKPEYHECLDNGESGHDPRRSYGFY